MTTTKPAKAQRFASVKLLPVGHPQRVPARQTNVMHGATYTQGFAAPVRPGALDFKTIGSKCFAQGGRHK